MIFCRNVLIYFDQDTKIDIFRRLAKATEKDGFLALGAAETVVGLTDVFKPYRDTARALSPRKASIQCRPKISGRLCQRAEGRCNGGYVTMSEENKGPERVTFSRGYSVCIMGIDGTWRRDCTLNAISDNDAILTVEGSIRGPQPQGILPAALVDRPRLSSLRTGSRQWRGDRCPVSARKVTKRGVRVLLPRKP